MARGFKNENVNKLEKTDTKAENGTVNFFSVT
jgi:hypothetical protein